MKSEQLPPLTKEKTKTGSQLLDSSYWAIIQTQFHTMPHTCCVLKHLCLNSLHIFNKPLPSTATGLNCHPRLALCRPNFSEF